MKHQNTEKTLKEAIRERFIEAVEYLLNTHSDLKKGDIANNLNVKPQILTEILGMRMYVQAEMIQKICEAYNVSPFFILFDTKPIVESFEEYIKTNKELYKSNKGGISYKEYMLLNEDDTPYQKKQKGSTDNIINLMDALKKEMITLSERVENAEKASKK